MCSAVARYPSRVDDAFLVSACRSCYMCQWGRAAAALADAVFEFPGVGWWWWWEGVEWKYCFVSFCFVLRKLGVYTDLFFFPSPLKRDDDQGEIESWLSGVS